MRVLLALLDAFRTAKRQRPLAFDDCLEPTLVARMFVARLA